MPEAIELAERQRLLDRFSHLFNAALHPRGYHGRFSYTGATVAKKAAAHQRKLARHEAHLQRLAARKAKGGAKKVRSRRGRRRNFNFPNGVPGGGGGGLGKLVSGAFKPPKQPKAQQPKQTAQQKQQKQQQAQQKKQAAAKARLARAQAAAAKRQQAAQTKAAKAQTAAVKRDQAAKTRAVKTQARVAAAAVKAKAASARQRASDQATAARRSTAQQAALLRLAVAYSKAVEAAKKAGLPIPPRPIGLSVELATDSLLKASTHEPIGTHGLWGHEGWQMPAYMQHVRNELIKSGDDESTASRKAVGIVKDWAAGRPSGGMKTIKPSTVTAARKAVAEWDALKAKAKASRGPKLSVELATVPGSVPVRSVGDGPRVTRTGGAYGAGKREPKTRLNAANRRRWAKTGVALPDGSFPIPDRAHLVKAMRAIGRAPADKRPKVRAHIARRARALGVQLPSK